MTVDAFAHEGEQIYREVLGGGVLPTKLTLSAFVTNNAKLIHSNN